MTSWGASRAGSRGRNEQYYVAPLHHLGPPVPRSTLGLLARGARPTQWLKNLLVFMAPAAAGVLGEWHTTLRVVGSLFYLLRRGLGHLSRQ